MLDYVIVIVAVGMACGLWAALQVLSRNVDPNARTIYEQGCDGGGSCGGGECKKRPGEQCVR